MNEPKCVRCGKSKNVRESGTTPHAWYCGDCQIEFEPEDDGRFGYGDPARQVANREAYDLAAKQRRRARR